MTGRKIRYTIRRYTIILTQWEYWSFNVMYLPIFLYWLWLSIKARSFFFFSTSNPGIENAGFVMESKKKIYDVLPPGYYPKTILPAPGSTQKAIEEHMALHNMQFPLVAKPDIGERGNAVKKMYSVADVVNYQAASPVPYLLQEWCSYPNEAGIFYCRYPENEKGFISGIVKKEFLTVTGDGKSTTGELLLKNDRYFLQYETLKKQLPGELQKVLKAGEQTILVPYGNHSRGTLFLDYSHAADEQLQATLNDICSRIPGFYFGRLDIRYESWELLRQGKHFSIIELNGAGSEPTHIYDPAHSVFFAWKEIARHLSIMYRIAAENKKKYNLSYLSFRQGIQLLKNKKKYDRLAGNAV